KKIRPKNEQAEEKTKQLVTLKQDDVQEITYERTSTSASADNPAEKASPAVTVKLKRTGSDWNVIEPVQDSADSSSISNMLTSLTTAKYERIVDDKPKDLDGYGLKTPLIKISLKKNEASPAEVVMIGRDTPVGASVYMRTGANETVYKVPSSVKSSADKTLK